MIDNLLVALSAGANIGLGLLFALICYRVWKHKQVTLLEPKRIILAAEILLSVGVAVLGAVVLAIILAG